jgi:hypothetical protein
MIIYNIFMSRLIRETSIKKAQAEGKIKPREAREAIQYSRYGTPEALEKITRTIGKDILDPMLAGSSKLIDDEIRDQKKKEEMALKEENERIKKLGKEVKLSKERKLAEEKKIKDKNLSDILRFLNKLIKQASRKKLEARRLKKRDLETFYDDQLDILKERLDEVKKYEDTELTNAISREMLEQDLNTIPEEINKLDSERNQQEKDIDEKNDRIKKFKLELKRAERDLDIASRNQNERDIAYHEAHINKIQDTIDSIEAGESIPISSIPTDADIAKYMIRPSPFMSQPEYKYERQIIKPIEKRKSNALGTKRPKSNVLKGIPVY